MMISFPAVSPLSRSTSNSCLIVNLSVFCNSIPAHTVLTLFEFSISRQILQSLVIHITLVVYNFDLFYMHTRTFMRINSLSWTISFSRRSRNTNTQQSIASVHPGEGSSSVALCSRCECRAVTHEGNTRKRGSVKGFINFGFLFTPVCSPLSLPFPSYSCSYMEEKQNPDWSQLRPLTRTASNSFLASPSCHFWLQ